MIFIDFFRLPDHNSFYSDWLVNGAVQKLILVIKGVESKAVLERWGFDCEMDKENIAALSSARSLRHMYFSFDYLMYASP